MKASPLPAAVASAVVTAILVAGVQARGQHAQHHPSGAPAGKHRMANSQTGAKLLHQEMLRSAKESLNGQMPMPRDTDRAFALMMAEHHASGVRMAQIELRHGNDPAAKRMARRIVQAQTKERAQLLALAKRVR